MDRAGRRPGWAAGSARRRQSWRPGRADRWHSSLQVRIVTTTFVASAAVVTMLGFFLMQEIATGLLSGKLQSATGQAENGLGNAEGQL